MAYLLCKLNLSGQLFVSVSAQLGARAKTIKGSLLVVKWFAL